MQPTAGRVLSVNVSRGGVPKLPVERAWVDRLGVAGDAHRERTVHGGPHRAVCLFSIEAIERLQSEGHPVEPGSVGENLTTTGIEWSLLPIGTRALIGDQLEIELASATTPCSTQKRNFKDGRFSRISIDLHPSDSRMYARVLAEGEVRPGDPISLLPPHPSDRAQRELQLARLDRAEAVSSLRTWRAAAEAGLDVRVVEDGELALCAAPDLPGAAFNRATGLAGLPNLVAEATRFFDEHASTGWLVTAGPPWPGSVADMMLDIYCAPAETVEEPPPMGLAIRRLGPGETAKWDVVQQAVDPGGVAEAAPSPWPATMTRLIEVPHTFLLVAELDDRPVGAAMLSTSRGVGWLRAAAVVPAARGRGIQRALIAARAQLARDEGCELLGSAAIAATPSAINLQRTGFAAIGRRELHRYVPTSSAA
jgi:MOSC domain-containing protein YiiM/GNAT superfamily N-acetyltransferase